jgi:hypothetical protein
MDDLFSITTPTAGETRLQMITRSAATLPTIAPALAEIGISVNLAKSQVLLPAPTADMTAEEAELERAAAAAALHIPLEKVSYAGMDVVVISFISYI